jgi:hypothetical protein
MSASPVDGNLQLAARVAVVQGLSQRPFMDDIKHWGLLTIGTGLGNALYSNRESNDRD